MQLGSALGTDRRASIHRRIHKHVQASPQGRACSCVRMASKLGGVPLAGKLPVVLV